MASPVLDASGMVNHQVGAVSSTTVTVSTTAAAGVLIIATYNENAAAARTVSSVTAAGLTFAARKSLTNTNASCNNGTIDVWSAPWSGGALSALVVTVNFTGATNAATVIAAPFTGSNNNSNPWDSNGGLAYTAITAAASSPPTIAVTTTQANDLLLGFAVCTGSAGNTLNAPTGWTLPTNGDGSNPNGGPWLDFGFYYKSVSVAQSAVNVTIPGAAVTDGFACIIDAITADAATGSESGTVSMAFSGIAMAGAGTDSHPATGNMAFGGIAFSDAGTVLLPSGSAAMAFAGIGIVANGADLGVAASTSNPATASAAIAKNLQPLSWNVSIVDPKTGFPSPELQRKWAQNFKIIEDQGAINTQILPQSYVDTAVAGAINVALGYATAAQTNAITTAEAFAANASNLTSGTIPNARIVGLPSTAIAGVADGSNAVAGFIGEYLSNTVLAGSAVPGGATATNIDITTLTLPAGDWDVGGTVYYVPDASWAPVNISAWVGSASVTVPATPNDGERTSFSASFSVASGQILACAVHRFSLTVPTTLYLSCRATFGAGSYTAYGIIHARRAR